MAPWEAIKALKALSGKLTGDGEGIAPDELAQFLATMAVIIETQQHDLQVMKATVARLEHHVRHKHILQ